MSDKILGNKNFQEINPVFHNNSIKHIAPSGQIPAQMFCSFSFYKYTAPAGAKYL